MASSVAAESGPLSKRQKPNEPDASGPANVLAWPLRETATETATVRAAVRRVHMRLRGVSASLPALQQAEAYVSGFEDEAAAAAVLGDPRFEYLSNAPHLRPLVRDRCAYHLLDDEGLPALLTNLPAELQPPAGSALKLVDLRLKENDYPYKPHLERFRDICNEAELWDDSSVISTLLTGGRYQVLGFRALLQTSAQRTVDGGCLFRMLWQPEPRRLVLNTLAFAVDESCRMQGCGTRFVAILGEVLRHECGRAARFHGSVDDSLMLVDALEPEFYSRRGFKASADATVIANEIKQWLTNDGTAEELRTRTMISHGNHVPKMICRWEWQRTPTEPPPPAASLRRSHDEEPPPVLTEADACGAITTNVGDTFADVAARCGVSAYALLSVNPLATVGIERRRVLNRRLKHGTSLQLPSPAFSSKLFHFEWVQCDTCEHRPRSATHVALRGQRAALAPTC